MKGLKKNIFARSKNQFVQSGFSNVGSPMNRGDMKINESLEEDEESFGMSMNDFGLSMIGSIEFLNAAVYNKIYSK